MKKQLKEKFRKEHSEYINELIKKNSNCVNFEEEQEWIINWMEYNKKFAVSGATSKLQ